MHDVFFISTIDNLLEKLKDIIFPEISIVSASSMILMHNAYTFLHNEKIVGRGLPLKRKDLCEWEKKIYQDVLKICLNQGTINEIAYYLIDAIYSLLNDKIPINLLIIEKTISTHYALSPNGIIPSFIKKREEEGKPQIEENVLKYVIVKDSSVKLCDKMFIFEEYCSLQHKYQPKIDSNYYLSSVGKRIDRIISVSHQRNNLFNIIYTRFLIGDHPDILKTINF